MVTSFGEYYNGRAKRALSGKKRPTPLPITLTLTIYGISSIQPGDIFRVNYLPEMYKDRVYFQVMKVSQELNSSGWITSLETVMRIRPDKKFSNSINIFS